MYTKVAVFFLLISVVHQGFADSTPSDKEVGYSNDVSNLIESATNILPLLGYNGLARGVDYCKLVIRTVGSEIKHAFNTIKTFQPDAFAAYEKFKACGSGNDLQDCRGRVMWEYLNIVGKRLKDFNDSLVATILAVTKIPTCIFQRE